MILRALFVAIAAGILAGAAISLVQMVKVTPVIHAAEFYENAAPASDTATGHEHDDGNVHDNGEGWAPSDGIERLFYTWMANMLIGVGYGLLLIAGFVLSGRKIDARQGLFWGLAGFLVFALSPAVLLPPEVPGAVAAPLPLRQLMWFGVVISTASGLALLAFNRSKPLKTLGVALIVLPLLVPTPHSEGTGSVPPELAAQFVVVSLGAAVIFWACLGSLSGALYQRYVS